MTPLGRGLASLIPRRYKEKAEDILEQIDSMEAITDEPENVKALRQARHAVEIEEEEDDDVPVNQEPVIARRQLNVIEEPVEPVTPMPIKPLVTPLTIEAEPDETDKEIFGEDEELEDDVEEKEEIVQAVNILEEDDLEVDDSDEETVQQDEPSSEERDEVEPAKLNKPKKQEAVVAEKREDYEDFLPVGARRVLGEKVEYIAIGDIQVNPLQPRRVFDPSELTELVQSLEQHGMLQPLVVIKNTGEVGYQLIAGERRLRASKQLGWDHVPCVVRSDVRSDRHRLELALTENVQRQNLNPIEEAMGYQRLNEEYGMTHEEIGRRVGRSRVGVTNIIRLLQLPAEIQRGLMEGKVSIGHARAILMIPDEEKQIRFYKHVLEEGLTVRKTENRARHIQRTMNLNDPMRNKMRGRPQLAIKYDGLLQDKFGYNARVKFESSKNRFEVVFYAFSEGEAEELISRMLSLKGKGLPNNVDDDVVEDD